MTKPRQLLSGLIALLLLSPAVTLAENSKVFGDYVIHYNAMAADFIPAEIARKYRITRSRNRGLINITVLKNILGAPGQPVHAQVRVSALNLVGQGRTIHVREIREGNAIYYIGEFSIAHEETLKFNVQAQPRGTRESVEVNFSQDFYTSR